HTGRMRRHVEMVPRDAPARDDQIIVWIRPDAYARRADIDNPPVEQPVEQSSRPSVRRRRRTVETRGLERGYGLQALRSRGRLHRPPWAPGRGSPADASRSNGHATTSSSNRSRLPPKNWLSRRRPLPCAHHVLLSRQQLKRLRKAPLTRRYFTQLVPSDGSA